MVDSSVNKETSHPAGDNFHELMEKIKSRITSDPLEPEHYKALSKLKWARKASGEDWPPESNGTKIDISINRVLDLFRTDDLEMAELILRTRLLNDPEELVSIRLFAELARRLGYVQGAENLLRYALEIDPFDSASMIDIARIYRNTNRNDDAIAIMDQLLAREPDSTSAIYTKASACSQAGRAEEAVDLFARLTQLDASAAAVWIGYGRALKTMGKANDAERVFRKAIELAPDSGEAWWSLSDLKTAKFDDCDISEIETLLEQNLSVSERCYASFALGKAFEDRKAFEASFQYYSAGNSLRRKILDYDPNRFEDFVEESKRIFSNKFFEQRTDYGIRDARPIFILGMTRAGSTLVEQILASHSHVEGTMELLEMLHIARSLGEELEERNAAIAALEQAASKELGTRYVQLTQKYRFTSRPLFIDKMPNNWLYIPLIHLALPNAVIIDARRHPMACCFSNFKQHFGRGQDWSYNLTELGRYYRAYVEMMDHVDRVLPDRIYRVYHERLLAQPEAEIRALLDHIGLPFEANCIEFYRTQRPVRTASAAQVRQPLTKSGVDLWKSYEPWLDELKRALGPVLDQYPA